MSKLARFSAKNAVKSHTYTDKEMEILVHEVGINKKTLFGSFSNEIMQKKQLLWKNITSKINATSNYNREIRLVKKKWQDLSSRTKVKAGKLKKAKNGTGGGKITCPPLTPLEQKVRILHQYR